MESWLANIVTKLKQAVAALRAGGPAVLIKGADALVFIESAMRQAAEFISIGGPYGVSEAQTDIAKKSISELWAIKAELGTMYAAPEPAMQEMPAQFAAIQNMGLLGSAISRPLIGILIQIVTKVLTKVGSAPPAPSVPAQDKKPEKK